MNITGQKNYSQELTALRNPDGNTESLKRLLFLYPFGIDQSISNLPFQTFAKGDNDTVGDALRSFFTISVLKEIFTSNALNLITLASTYDRKKRMSEDKNNVLINNLLRGETNYPPYKLPSLPNYDLPEIDSMTLQSKVDQKVSKLKVLLKQDPRIKKLLPYMEVITLNNFLDVPVIAGTFKFDLDTTSLFTLLAGAIASRKSLANWSEVKSLFNQIKSMPEQSVYQMFQVLSNIEKPTKVPSVVNSMNLPGGNPDIYFELQNRLKTTNNVVEKEEIQKKMTQIENEYATQNIALLKDFKLKELERNMMFMMDPVFLMNRYGLNHDAAQAKSVMTKISPQTDLLFSKTKQQLLDFVGAADILFSSVYMILSPVVATDENWGHDYLTMRQKLMDVFEKNFDTFIDSVKSQLSNSLSENLESSLQSITEFNTSCDQTKEELISSITFFNKKLSESQVFPTFGFNDVKRFTEAVDSIVGKFDQIKRNLENSIIKIVGTENFSKTIRSFNLVLSTVFDSYFSEFKKTGDPESKLQARLFAIDYDSEGDQREIIKRRKLMFENFLREIEFATRSIFQTVFLLLFKSNLCDYVDIADVEFNIAKADVLSLPNYCLVLPVEVVQALFILYTKRQWKTAVMMSGSGFNPLNGSNIKGFLKTLKFQLNIPNLIVFDQKRNEVFYSFAFMGAQTEKIKMNAMEIFVKNYLTDDKSGVSQVFY